MLTTQSYLVAMCIYLAAAFAGLLLIRRSWFPETLTRTAGLALGLVAGLLFTPAFPGSEVPTMAPALIVVIFNALFGRKSISSNTCRWLYCYFMVLSNWRRWSGLLL